MQNRSAEKTEREAEEKRKGNLFRLLQKNCGAAGGCCVSAGHLLYRMRPSDSGR